ncbi:hypothetical protein QUB61_02830 [Microcoleus sp. C2D2]
MPVPQRVSFLVGWAEEPVPVEGQKPGFFTKYFVTHRKFGKKPGFFVGVRQFDCGMGVRNRQDACSTKSQFFVVVCSHLEQARCLFHKESV